MVSHWKFQPAFKGRQEKLTDFHVYCRRCGHRLSLTWGFLGTRSQNEGEVPGLIPSHSVNTHRAFNSLKSPKIGVFSALQCLWPISLSFLIFHVKDNTCGTSLAVQRLRLCLPMQGDTGLIPGGGAKIPRASRPKNQSKDIKQKQYCNKVNKDFKNGSFFFLILKQQQQRQYKCLPVRHPRVLPIDTNSHQKKAKGTGALPFYENLFGPFSGLLSAVLISLMTWSARVSPRPLQTTLCTETCAFQVGLSGAEETNTISAKQQAKPRSPLTAGSWWSMTAGSRQASQEHLSGFLLTALASLSCTYLVLRTQGIC